LGKTVHNCFWTVWTKPFGIPDGFAQTVQKFI
jgi:hypothetical protein